MSDFIYTFMRKEKKYLLSRSEYEMLMSIIGSRLLPDKYGLSTIGSLYLDTPSYRLIRDSIDAVSYKEKIRLRTYGSPSSDSNSFLEIKKKFKGVVYKRRISLRLSDAMAYIDGDFTLPDSQIAREINYFMHFYSCPVPKAAIFCERQAFTVPEEDELRLTFDRNIRARLSELRLELGSNGTLLIPDGYILLEIKMPVGMPIWLSSALDRCKIYSRSFSKYGTAYSNLIIPQSKIIKGEFTYA